MNAMEKAQIKKMIAELMESVPPSTSKPKFAESSMKLTCVLLLENCDDCRRQTEAIDSAIDCLERLKVFIG